jgi:xanthine dehydrogenase accessory factor
MENIYQEASRQLARRKKLALVEIVANQGSMPRGKGAQMLVDKKGGAVGTVGGGCLELIAVNMAKVAILTGRGYLVDFSLSGEDVANTDMICGGDGIFLITPLTAADLPVMRQAAAAVSGRRHTRLVTLLEDGRVIIAHVDENDVVFCAEALTPEQKRRVLAADDSPPAMSGQKTAAGQTTLAKATEQAKKAELADKAKRMGMPGQAEGAELVERAGQVEQTGQAALAPYDYARFLTPTPLLYIFGGGHVGLETAKLCANLDFEQVVVDDRAEYANQTRFPWARCLVAASPADLPALEIDEQTYILIMTRGHLMDYQWLSWVMSLPALPAYLGMIGSRRKIGMIEKRLRESGVSQTRIERLHSPVGLDIGAQTPAEIAVSIGAQLIQARSG